MSRIAAAFDLQPPIYLIKEYDNCVSFPSEGSGKFNPASLMSGYTYKVCSSENTTQTMSPPTQAPGTCPQTPFGSYPAIQGQTKHKFAVPLQIPHPPRSLKRVVKKSIVVANLSARDGSRASSSKTNGLTYTEVTQVLVSLTVAECNVLAVSEFVRAQLGFEVVLLDSKLYPIANIEATSGMDYWKSTRKIIAASRSLYERLGGVSPDAALAMQEDDDIVLVEPSAKKAKKKDDNLPNMTSLEDIHKKLDSIGSKVSFHDNLRKTFECVICRLAVHMPIVAPCCQRIVGCKRCVERWVSAKSSCPFCSVRGLRLSQTIQVKGLDDVTDFFRVGQEEEADHGEALIPDFDYDDDDDDFLPPIRVRQPLTTGATSSATTSTTSSEPTPAT